MELSINAIVTLVIALTVLAFGLGMVTGVLSFGGSTLAQAVDGYRLEIPATSNNHIVISDPLPLDKGDANVVIASYYNSGHAACDDIDLVSGAWFYLECPGITWKRVQTVAVNVPSGKALPLGISLELNKDTPSGSHPCFVRIFCEDWSKKAPNAGVLTPPIEGYIESKPIFVEVGR